MLKVVLTALLLSLTSLCFSQHLIKGRLLNNTDNKPIPYANIGILNSSVGTLSNGDGTFLISIPTAHYSDTLLFSALGYAREFVPVLKLINKGEVAISLTERITTLEQVEITAKKKKGKSYFLGNRYTKGGFLYGDSVSAGAAMALLIENKYPSYHADLTLPFLVESINVYIDKNSIDNFKLRVRLLERHSVSGEPGKDLLSENIIITSSIKRGWLNVDLKSYNFLANEPFYLVLEWIMDDVDRLSLLNQYAVYKKANPDKVKRDTTIVDGKKIGFWSYLSFSPGTHLGVSPLPFSLQNYTCYYRTNSFGEWKRAPVVLTARVSVIPLHETSHQKSDAENLADQVLSCDKLCTDFIANNNVNGMQIAVMKHGKIAFSKGYGLSDVEKGTIVTPQTRFRIGSISKALTSAAILDMQRENTLHLDTLVTAYLPLLRNQRWPFTTRQLAGHTAGVRHYKDEDINDLIRNEHFSSAIDALNIIKDDTLLFKPGRQYHYSSFGWNIIAAIIESVKGQSYLDYMTQTVWRPLNMINTQGATQENLLRNCSKGYSTNGELFEKEDFSYKYASGGLISTSEDLIVFGQSLLNTKSDPLTTQLFQSMYLSNGKATSYGIGWNIGRDFNNHRIFFHSGSLINGSGYLIIYPDDDLVVAFLANSPEGLSFEVQKLGALFYSK